MIGEIEAFKIQVESNTYMTSNRQEAEQSIDKETGFLCRTH